MKTDCERCNGSGKILVRPMDPEADDDEEFCPDCMGSDVLHQLSRDEE